MRIAAASLVLALTTAALAGDEPAWRAETTDAAIPLRDGRTLAAHVLLPAAPGRYPAIVIQTPYDRRVSAAAIVRGARGPWDREHYAYVVADWRGFFGSRAAGRARPGQRGEDGFDVVEWTAAQPWCDGKVGTWGPSALGRVQFDTAKEKPPHLVCCVPLVAPLGTSYDDFYEGGVFKEAHVAKLDVLGFGVGSLVASVPAPDAPAWRIAAAAERPEMFDVPMFLVTGWYDHATTRTIASFRALAERGGPRTREGSRLLVGPWEHMAVDETVQGDLSFGDAAGEAARETRLFFDHHLRGTADSPWTKRERVRVWRVNEKGWTGADAWPPPDASATTWTLHANGAIDRAPAKADEGARAILDDPASPVPTVGGANLPAPHVATGPRDQAPITARDDVLVYRTETLAEPLRLDGAAVLTVWLRADRTDTDLAVRLCEEFADGRTMLAADTIRRARFRRAGRDEPLVPGEAVEMTVALPPLALTFRAGSRLALVVSGTNWPRYERNAHTGALHFDAAAFAPARVEILHDAAHPARLVTPFVRAAESAHPR